LEIRTGHLAATMPKPGLSWQAAGLEAIITFGLVLMILNMANGPKLNGPFVPLAVGPTSWPGARWAARLRAPR
jgi:glycerol uptake facilitator-like aquaporin